MPSPSDRDAVPVEPDPEADPSRSTSNFSLAFTRMQRRVLRALVGNLSRTRAEGSSVEAPPRTVGTYARWLPVLRLVPWVLALTFVASFAWDFPGTSFTIGGRTVVVEGLIRIVAVSGLIGFLTNWLAITMLFQPREPRPIVGQGVIPSQRERVAYRLAQAVSDELINEEIIIAKIHESGLAARYRDLALAVATDVLDDDVFRREFKSVVQQSLERTLTADAVQDRIVQFTAEQLERSAGSGLPGFALRTYRLLNEDDFQKRLRSAVEQLPHSLDPVLDEVDPLLDALPERLERRADTVESLLTQLVLRFVEALDVERIVLENVRDYDERQLEALLKRTTNEQLTYIKYLGGVLGAGGGLVIWAPVVALTGFAILGGGIYLLDEALYRARN